jgi:CRP/FNR family cyclic AMP-dependent transcriptional regulator
MSDPIELDDLAPLLRRVSMFSRCTDGESRQIARHAEFREVPKGARLITKGDEGSDLFVLLTGTADAVLDGDVRRSFDVGDYFGELAALAPAPRTSDVVATDWCTVAVLSRADLHRVVETVPGAAFKMLEGLAIRMREQIAPD